MPVTQGTTEGRRRLIESDLPRYMSELDQIRFIPVDLRRKRIALKQELTTLKITNLVMANDQLLAEDARLILMVQAEKGADNKAKYSNETTREAAKRQLQATDADYKAALEVYRRVELQIAQVELKIEELDDEIKSHAEMTWTLRELVSSARAEVAAMCSFDADLPHQIVHVVADKKEAA